MIHRFLQFSGMTGILSGMVVAFKQIRPEQEVSLSSVGLRVKVGLLPFQHHAGKGNELIVISRHVSSHAQSQ